MPCAKDLLGTLALAFACASSLACTHAGAPTTVIAVRHAEKRTSGEDPGLTPAGEERARRLRDLARHAGVTALYATQYRRTQATLEPLAEALGLEVEIVDARDLRGLAERILAEHRGGAVVVAGHSNTLPGIVAALGAVEPEPVGESEYGNLFLVTIPSSGRAGVLRLQF